MLEPESDKLIRLAQTLARHTVSGRIHWEPRVVHSSDDSERFEYSTASSTVTVDNAGGTPFDGYLVMRVANQDGLVIASLEMHDHSTEEVDGALQELFDAARRQALNVDETLDSLLAEVEKLDEPPF